MICVNLDLQQMSFPIKRNYCRFLHKFGKFEIYFTKAREGAGRVKGCSDILKKFIQSDRVRLSYPKNVTMSYGIALTNQKDKTSSFFKIL